MRPRARAALTRVRVAEESARDPKTGLIGGIARTGDAMSLADNEIAARHSRTERLL